MLIASEEQMATSGTSDICQPNGNENGIYVEGNSDESSSLDMNNNDMMALADTVCFLIISIEH